MIQAKAIPDGFHTLTPHLVVRDANRAIDFYKRAFGAEVRSRVPGPDGKSVMHAELKIGDSIVMLCDEFPGMKDCVAPQSLNGTTVTLHLYVHDADAATQRAVAAGAQVTMPLMDAFWGDRYGKVTDPFGHQWSIAAHQRDVTPDQIQKAAAEWFSKSGGEGK